MQLKIPSPCVVVLIGISGSGKSTLARRLFLPTEILSSDTLRGVVCDDEASMEATDGAFAALHFLMEQRLRHNRTVVVDATNLRPEDRKSILQLAHTYHTLTVALVLDLPERLCQERNALRPRPLPAHALRSQHRTLRAGLRDIDVEGFHRRFFIRDPSDLDTLTLTRQPLWSDLRGERGPFDIVGDIHGCDQELLALLAKLGWSATRGADTLDDAGEVTERGHWTVTHPEGRKLLFLGDLVDRGPGVAAVLEVVMDACAAGVARCVLGNHEAKLLRYLRGGKATLTHGLAASVEQLSARPAAFREEVASFLDTLIAHYVLDEGRLVVAHAGLSAELQGRASGRVREFALYGQTTGETDEYGLPVRYPWALDYKGKAAVVYGHTPVPSVEWINNTVCVDTGCVYGGKLTALRWPERAAVSVPALQAYVEAKRPIQPPVAPEDNLLDLAEVTGRQRIETAWGVGVGVRPEELAAALESSSRFGVDPRWCVYLPPTMSPAETSEREGYLEHPEEALGYYQKAGLDAVVCEEKHMGSRAVVVIARSAEAAARRFWGVEGDGVVMTRTGRPFFSDPSLQAGLLARLRAALDATGFWDALQTDWAVLDGELMPWSAKAKELLRTQYAAVGAAAGPALQAAAGWMPPSPELDALLARTTRRQGQVSRFVDAYRRYCWDVGALDDYRFAPFHLMATEGALHVEQTHRWHMETLARFTAGDPLLQPTRYLVIDPQDPAQVAEAVAWWEALVGAGGEGMVVKPGVFLAKGLTAKGEEQHLQPAIKVRGPEYLRIIYGPEYDASLPRLRKRAVGTKRGLAIREFFLGLEGLRRLIAREPLRRVHACMMGVLAMESEPVDPRL